MESVKQIIERVKQICKEKNFNVKVIDVCVGLKNINTINEQYRLLITVFDKKHNNESVFDFNYKFQKNLDKQFLELGTLIDEIKNNK